MYCALRRTSFRQVGVGIRCMSDEGFFSKMKSGFQSKTDERRDMQMRKEEENMIQSLFKAEKFTLSTYRDMLVDSKKRAGGDKWYSKIPGIKKITGVDDVENLMTIFDAITPEELEEPTKIKTNQVLRIANESGKSKDEVSMLLSMYKQFNVVHAWIQRRKQNNIQPANNFRDIMIGMRNDKRGVPAAIPRWQVARILQQRRAKGEIL